MKKITLMLCCIVISLYGIAQTKNVSPGYIGAAKENDCFKNFNYQTSGRNKVNTFLLAKISQLMYTERLDFELRKLQKPQEFPPRDFESKNLNTNSNRNFEIDFAKRFSHWFYDTTKKPVKPLPSKMNTQQLAYVGTEKIIKKEDLQLKGMPVAPAPAPKPAQPTAMDIFITDSIAFDKQKPLFKFLNKKQDFASFKLLDHEIRIPGFDPEVMVISTNDYIIVSWRGTDNVYKDDKWEWIASDFYFIPVDGDGPLANAKLHAGMWTSFKLIKDRLMFTLNTFEAKTKNKKIFVTGHSLGGGMALVSAPYLAGKGYNIGGVYTFAAPRTIGDKAYVDKCNNLIGREKIQRFEYGVDPIPKMWSPLLYASQFKIPGVRNWYSASADDKSDEYYDCEERVFPMTIFPWEYDKYSKNKIDKENGDFGLGIPFDMLKFIDYVAHAEDGSKERPKDGRGFTLIDFGMHNPDYYTLKAYKVMSDADKAKLPSPANTFPYLYPGVRNNK